MNIGKVSNLKDDTIVYLDYQTINSMHAMNFKVKVINFTSIYITRFYSRIRNMHKDNNDLTSS